MLRENIGTGASIEEALDNAIEGLGLKNKITEYDHEILELPKKGLLGIGNKPAKVRVWYDDGKPAPKVEEKKPQQQKVSQPKPVEKTEVKPEKQENSVNVSAKAEAAEKYLANIISNMNIEGTSVTKTVEGKNVCLHIVGDEKGISIGHRGETLNALQYLCGLAANRAEGDFARVSVDSGTYRDKRRKTLEDLAHRMAKQVVKTGRSQKLEPMAPYERRIIHSAVSEVEGATSISEGEEPNRYVIISSTGAIKPEKPQHNNHGKKNNSRKERPAPYEATTKREVAPTEAGTHSLYGKIEL